MSISKRISYALSIVVLFGMLGASSSSADVQWLPLGGVTTPAGSEPSVVETPQGNEALGIDVHIFGVHWEQVNTKEGTFTRIDLPGAGHATEIGRPRLPVIRKLIELPYDAEVKLEIMSAQSEDVLLPTVGISYPLIPTQPPIPKVPGAHENAPFAFDSSFYAIDNFSPSELVELGETAYIRAHRVIQISIYPIQYNPGQATMRCYSRLNIVVKFIGGNIGKTQALTSRYSSPSFDTFLKETILNFGQFSPAQGTKATSSEGLLFIVADAYEASIQSLADWKREKGFKVEVANTTTAGSTTTQIKNFIQSRYNTWVNPALSYVVLVGDTNTIPSFSGTTGSHVSDLYYATLSGTDYLPDVWMGRMSVSTSAQTQTVVSRTVGYELANLASTAWLKKATFIATCDTGFYQVAEGTHNYVISQYMNPHGYTSDKLYCITYGAGTADVRNAVNNGRSLVTYSGHGSETSWGGPSFTISNIESLTNGDMTPFVTSHACLTGSIQVSECFGEKWLRKAAIGFWGASNSTYWDEDDYLEKGMYKGVFDQHLYTLGQMVRYGLDYVYAVYGGGGRSKYYFEIYHLLGDPTLELWTAQPSSFNVYHDTHAVVGATSFLAIVQSGGLPLQGALVCVDKASDGVHEVALTDSSGRAQFSLSPPLLSPGTLKVTATKHDAEPYQGTVTVVQPIGPYLSYSGHTFEDLGGGGGDGYASPGEPVLMPVMLKNFGTETCLHPVVQLHTESPWVETIIDPTADYPDIAPSSTEVSVPPHVAWKSYSATPDRTLIPFTLDWTCEEDGSGSTMFFVEICADADGDGYTSCAGDCDDWNDEIHPGATEVCDGLDNNCDGYRDEGFADYDNDGAAYCVDCDDTDPARYPGALEACDGIDNDCDGIVPATESDADNDGYRICDGDCNDTDPNIHPGASEICSDGKDNDCDGAVDSADSDCQTGWSLASSATLGEGVQGTKGRINGHMINAISIFAIPALGLFMWSRIGRLRSRRTSKK